MESRCCSIWFYISAIFALARERLSRYYHIIMTYSSSLKLVAAALRPAELAFSGVSQISVDGQEHVGIGTGSVHVTGSDRHRKRVSCRNISMCVNDRLWAFTNISYNASILTCIYSLFEPELFFIFISIALYTRQIVSKHCHSMKQENNIVAKLIDYEK